VQADCEETLRARRSETGSEVIVADLSYRAAMSMAAGL